MAITDLMHGYTAKKAADRQDVVGHLRDLAHANSIDIEESTELAEMLIEAILEESDKGIRLDLLDALDLISSNCFGITADWDRLREYLDKATCYGEIEACIYILGNTLDGRYLATVERFLHFDDEAVRAAAETALGELRYAEEKRRR